MNYLLLHGDARRIPLGDETVQCCVTSPPYWGLRQYGCAGQIGLEPTIERYVAEMVAVFREVWRVLRKDGTCWVNLGDSYCGTTAERQTSKTSIGDGKHGYWTNPNINKRCNDDSLKPKDLCMIPARVALALQADGWWLRSDIIWAKCLSGGTIVYAKTQKGETPMTIKDMVRLDPATVQLWDGEKWNQAVSWVPSPRDGDGLEIELRNGVKIGCTPNHVWPIENRGTLFPIEMRRASDLRPGDTLKSCRLPEPSEQREPSMLPDLDIGWFVGLYLAEGSQSEGTIQISGHIKETARFERLQQIAADYDGHCFTAKTSENGATINLGSSVLLGVINAYVSGKVAKDKHLNPRCWKRSNLFLSSILAGYLSGDGARQTEDRW